MLELWQINELYDEAELIHASKPGSKTLLFFYLTEPKQQEM